MIYFMHALFTLIYGIGARVLVGCYADRMTDRSANGTRFRTAQVFAWWNNININLILFNGVSHNMRHITICILYMSFHLYKCKMQRLIKLANVTRKDETMYASNKHGEYTTLGRFCCVVYFYASCKIQKRR